MSGSWTPIACCRTLDRQRDSYGIILRITQFKPRAMVEGRTGSKAGLSRLDREVLSRLDREWERYALRYDFANES